MKKYFVSAAFIALISACGGGSGSSDTKDTSAAATDGSSTTASTDVSDNPDYKAGLALVAKSDCLTCHDIATKKIGPAYQDVANKYAGVDTAIQHLSHKIINGGSGVWGDVAMTPHQALSQADAEQMVKYILLLKTN